MKALISVKYEQYQQSYLRRRKILKLAAFLLPSLVALYNALSCSMPCTGVFCPCYCLNRCYAPPVRCWIGSPCVSRFGLQGQKKPLQFGRVIRPFNDWPSQKIKPLLNSGHLLIPTQPIFQY